MHQVDASVNGISAMPHSRTRTILTSVATFSALSLLPKLLVVAKDAVVAFYFGTGQALDLYLMALVLIGMPVSIVVVALQTTLIPALVGKDAKATAGLLRGALEFALLTLMLVLPVWLLILPYVVNLLFPGATDSTHSDLQEACYWLIPYYFLNGINLLLYGALQARKVFWLNALLPGILPISILTTLWITKDADIHALLIGNVTSSLIECLVLFFILTHSGWFRWLPSTGYGLRTVLSKSLPLMFGGIIASLAPLVEQIISFGLGPGAISLLSYGNKVPAAVNTLLVTGIGIVVLPHFADLISARQWRESRTLYLRLSLIVFAIGATVAAAGLVFANDIIRLLFERGAFTVADSGEAANVMRVYLLQLPFLLAAMISLRTLAAMNKTIAMTTIAIAQLIIASGLSYKFSVFYGVVGVAMGTAIGGAAGAGLLAWAVRLGFENKSMEYQNEAHLPL